MRSAMRATAFLAPLALSPEVFGQSVEVTPSNTGALNTMGMVHEVTTAVPNMITAVVNSADYQGIGMALFLGLATFTLAFALYKYVISGNLTDLLESVFVIGFTWVLMLGYLVAIFALYDWQRDFSAIIQQGILGSTNEFYALETIWNIIKSFDFSFTTETASWNPLVNLKTVLADVAFWLITIVFVGLMLLLLVATMVVSMLGLWGYIVLAIVGYMLIPTLLFKPLSFLFDGWLRTMFTVLLYAVLGRVVLSVAAFGFDLLLGAPDGSGIQAIIHINPVYGFTQFLGLFLWAAVALASMRSVMNYAQSIVAGAGAAMADARNNVDPSKLFR